jgi:hypothetical protein
MVHNYHRIKEIISIEEYYLRNPELHPLYESEWKEWWYSKYLKLKMNGINPKTYNFIPEWQEFWWNKLTNYYLPLISMKQRIN